ncbi:NFACT RNA binding domain-containing protein [Negadavirga shengliensis]|uniref:NFACT RNA binding domain-containing protein n=1 Tax=Negadavirga shengliensis TaxID=1389218 RepID=A0ABV9SYC9_9BACT
MHLNYHYFRFLCPALQRRLTGSVVSECFSQNKEELILEFHHQGSSFFIRALLLPSNTCLSFPKDFKRSKKNNISLFEDLVGLKVTHITLLEFERAFYIRFDSGHLLLFKMHGSRSNVLLYDDIDQPPVSLFRKELREDNTLHIQQLQNPLNLTKERFVELDGNASKFLPTLGKLPREWLKKAGYLETDLEGKYRLMQQVMDMLESPLFSVYNEGSGYLLTLLPCDNPLSSTTDPIEAANLYYRYAVVYHAFEGKKESIIKNLLDQKRKTEAYVKKTREKLRAMEDEAPPSQIADVIMANLHQIPKGKESVQLFDFYRNEEIEVHIKKGLTPQKHAENLYRKNKNRKIEFDQLRKNLEVKEALLAQLEMDLEEVTSIADFKALKAFIQHRGLTPSKKQDQEATPFKRFEHGGFEILVGKSAKANDEMLRRYAWKEDLWLHAKDVSGSHVIIKYQSGMQLPKNVLERAAELAAHYSKNRNESLSAVIYTPCKFVRKVKGSAPGAVMVDKEKVIMVKPRGPISPHDETGN